MARYTGASCRQCRREGMKLFLKGDRCYTDKCAIVKRNYAPGQHGQGRKKVSGYGLQLREKQKVKRIYGVLETQFRNLYARADKMAGMTGVNLLSLLERRLDNVVYRMGLASSRKEARQLVTHGHFLVNGKKVDIPSYRVKVGDVISLKDKDKELKVVLDSLAKVTKRVEFINYNDKKMEATYVRLPERGELNADINESLIVEFYNR